MLASMRSLETLPTPFATVPGGTTTRAFFHGDCLALLARLAPESVDVVVTSPPYNLGIRYRSYDDTQPRRAYLRWTRQWLTAVARVLAPDGSLFLNVGAKPTDPWAGLDVARVARRVLTLQNTIHWIKSIAIDREAAGGAALARDLAVGHYQPINSARFVNDCHEYLFHFTPRGRTALDRTAVGVPYQDKSNVTRWAGAAADRRCRGNTWFLPYDTIKSRDKDRPHPATFPPRLPEQCIRLHGRDRVRLAMDPFVGLGSTALACARLDVDCIGIDVDEVYLGEAVKRTAAESAAPRGRG
jgi:site-specific DNA-methyltransferase (adenine-specific)